MSTATTASTATRDLGLEAHIGGSGPPLLFLHGEAGLLFSRPLLDLLEERFTVVAPSHPGWGGSARKPDERTIDDLSYRYLDLLDALDEPTSVVGCSLGAWLAMEIATKDRSRISDLTLVSPVGIRTGEPTRRYYLDRYAVTSDVLATALYGTPDDGPDLSGRTDEEFLLLARAQETTAALTWQPYLHNTALLGRLHRVRRPVQIISGERDGIILAKEHVDTLAAALGGDVRAVVVADAGHRVEEQRPDEVAEHVVRFAAQPAAQPAARPAALAR
jgi:pimeloyl-ACP methyl ester carboxylesterase